jgi:hypothetical protein
MATYNRTSPYFATQVVNGYLDTMTWRDIPAQRDDLEFTIKKDYEYRPDLLAYDLYQDAGLWWVFSVRNNNTLKDPIYDFKAGLVIYLPKLSVIKTALGM